jgi:hypothetical protein
MMEFISKCGHGIQKQAQQGIIDDAGVLKDV